MNTAVGIFNFDSLISRFSLLGTIDTNRIEHPTCKATSTKRVYIDSAVINPNWHPRVECDLLIAEVPERL